jgi:hypothetical protein
MESDATDLRPAFIAAYGPVAGAEAAARAAASEAADESAAYSAGRAPWYRPHRLELPAVPPASEIWVDASMPRLMARLSQRRRQAVLLHHGYRWPVRRIAAMLGRDVAAVERDVASALRKLAAGVAGGGHPVADQVAAYAEILESVAPASEVLDASQRRALPLRSRPAAAAAVVVTAMVIGVIVVASRSDDGEGAGGDPASQVPPIEVELLNPGAVGSPSFIGEHTAVGPGAVTMHDGRYHMLAAAHGNGVATVAYAVSVDGIVWVSAVEDPVLDLAAAPWAPREFDRATPRSVVVDASGAWQLFFDISWFDKGSNRQRSHIGRAVAEAPNGEWVFDDLPVLSPAAERPWMSQQVHSPAVVAVTGGLVMAFVGSGDESGMIGVAQSRVGTEWDVRPGPVFGGFEEWLRGGISRVSMATGPEGFAMLYAGDDPSRPGLATSDNGLEWTPHPANPLSLAARLGGRRVFDFSLAVGPERTFVYVEEGIGSRSGAVAVLGLGLEE